MRRLYVVLALSMVGCGGTVDRRLIISQGEHHVPMPGGRVWYKATGAGTGTPLILLHGGPGFPSHYLKAFEELGDDRVVIRYDQLGGGHSDTTSDTTVMTVAHFVAELDSLRASLGIEKFHLLGHSWGTMLGIEYYRAHPDRVASLSFGSPVWDAPAFETRARSLIATLSDSAQRAIRRAEAAHAYTAPSYQNAMNEFYRLYLFRNPVQADLDSSFAMFGQNVYGYMWGPSEFTVTGTLKTFNVLDILPRITVPTLVTVGEFDEVGPELVRGHAALIPGARFEILPGAAHMTPWDAKDAHVALERSFLRAADSTARR